MCVLTVVRKDASYLLTSLESLKVDLPTTPPNISVEVRVVDVSSDSHRDDIREAKLRHPNFIFEKLSNKSHENCTELEMRSDSNRTDEPPCSVRQQTRDVLATLAQCSVGVADDGWVVLIEDDTETCPSAVESIVIGLQAMNAYMLASPGAWRFACFSSYFSGAAFPTAALPAFLSFAWAELARAPVDYLAWAGWALGATFKHQGNLFRHVGRVSAFEYRNADGFRREYDRYRFSAKQTDCAQYPLDYVRAAARYPRPRPR